MQIKLKLVSYKFNFAKTYPQKTLHKSIKSYTFTNQSTSNNGIYRRGKGK